MKNPVPADSFSTEQNILSVAERLFLERGFSLTSTTDIAREAGCNQALIHYYYRSKEKLFEAVFLPKALLFFSSLVSGFREEASFLENLKTLIESHYDLLQANPRLPFLLFNEINTNSSRILGLKEAVGERILYLQARLNRQLEEAVRAGEIRRITIHELIMNVVSLNITLFLGRPILQKLLGYSDREYLEEVRVRRSANVEFILGSLRNEK